jgi:hypothetical protein
MISICKVTGDSSGHVLIKNYQITGDYNSVARLSRAKTLDGDVKYTHSGVIDGDRNFEFECRLSETDQTTLKAIYEAGVQVTISFWEGHFTGYIYSLSIRRNGETKATIYFKEKIA